MEKDSARSGWHEVEISIDADHRDMVRFADAEDNNYQRIQKTFGEILRDRIEGSSQAKTCIPNWNRSNILAALNASRPSSGNPPLGRLTLEPQSSRDFSFGRVNTLAPDEPDEGLTPRRSAEQLLSRGSSGYFMHHLSGNSTTTLGTMGSNGSRGSDPRSGVSDEDRRSPGNDSRFCECFPNKCP